MHRRFSFAPRQRKKITSGDACPPPEFLLVNGLGKEFVGIPQTLTPIGRELKKQGLTMLKVVGLPGSFVVHKNIQNKISHDLIAKGKEISEFIDRSPNEPARCHLYRANPLITRDLLLPEEFAEAARLEDEAAAKYSEMATECERSE
jgi:hypothetical protein